MSDKGDAKNVSTIKGISGAYVLCAPEGTTLPEDINTQLSEAFKGVGFIGEDGCKEAVDLGIEKVTDMNGDIVDSYVADSEETLVFTLLELSETAMGVEYGSENVKVKDGLMTIDHNWSHSLDTLVWVLELVLKNGRRWRKVIPSAIRTEIGELEIGAKSIGSREVTLTYLVNGEGSTCKDYIQTTPSAASATPSTASVTPTALADDFAVENDYESMTRNDLLSLCGNRGIEVSSSANKADLVAALTSADSEVAA